jgi:hypothetical protein
MNPCLHLCLGWKGDAQAISTKPIFFLQAATLTKSAPSPAMYRSEAESFQVGLVLWTPGLMAGLGNYPFPIPTVCRSGTTLSSNNKRHTQGLSLVSMARVVCTDWGGGGGGGGGSSDGAVWMVAEPNALLFIKCVRPCYWRGHPTRDSVERPTVGGL